MDDNTRTPDAGRIMSSRSRRVFELLKENVRLNLRLEEENGL